MFGVRPNPTFRSVCCPPPKASCSKHPLEDRAMRTFSTRSALIASVAISGALVWGMAELLALQWARFTGRFRTLNTFRAS